MRNHTLCLRISSFGHFISDFNGQPQQPDQQRPSSEQVAAAISDLHHFGTPTKLVEIAFVTFCRFSAFSPNRHHDDSILSAVSAENPSDSQVEASGGGCEETG